MTALVCLFISVVRTRTVNVTGPQPSVLSHCVAFISFSPSEGIETIQWWCARTFGFLGSFLGLVVLAPLYAYGANRYQCGDSWNRITMAYLHEPTVEGAVAVVACVYFATASYLCTLLNHPEVNWVSAELLHASPAGELLHSSPAQRLSVATWAVAALGFMSLAAACSVVPVVYVMGESLPSDNRVGVGTTILPAVQASIGILQSVSSSLFIPFVCRKLASFCKTDVNQWLNACNLIQALRLLTSLVVPCLVTIILNQDCMGQWTQLWNPCRDGRSDFDFNITEINKLTGEKEVFVVVTQDDVCGMCCYMQVT